MARSQHPSSLAANLRRMVCLVGLVITPEALASSPGNASPSEALRAFMTRVGTVENLVMPLVGAATEPEADAAAFAKALSRYDAQRTRIDPLIPIIQKALGRTIDDEGAKLSRRQRLLRRVDAHAPLAGALEGASLRRSDLAVLRGPLSGGKELGPAFFALGRLMGAQVLEDLARRRVRKAGSGMVRLARFGALVAGSAQTLDELGSGLRAAHDAVGLLSRFPDTARTVIGEGTSEVVRGAKQGLSEFSQALQGLRKTLRAPGDLEPFVEMAATCPRALCRYEAVKVLRSAAWSAMGTPRGDRAELLLEQVTAHSKAPDAVKSAAQRAVTSLRASR